MKIGLDIDNVVADLDQSLEEEFKKEDLNKRNTGIVNKNARHVSMQYDWSNEERIEFFSNNMERIAKDLKPIKDAKFYIDKLLEEHHEIYLITHRVYPDYKNPFNTTKQWLEKNNINYTKLIFTKTNDKSNECIENKIDIMFDDDTGNCIRLKRAGVRFCLMCTKLNYNHRGDLPYVRNFKELYERIKDMNEIKSVILDTDMSNEVDDQFALTYLMNSLDNINLEAITIAPFSKSGYAKDLTIKDGVELSYDTTLKILDLIKEESYKEKVYKGATAYFNDKKEINDAVKKIIEICLKNSKTTILAIGAITNIALAIYLEPKIKDRIEIVWLGGNSFLSHQNREFNFKQDIEGIKYVFDSKVKLTVIPCRNVASHLTTTIYELNHYLGNTKIGEFLINNMINCKKTYYKNKTDDYGSSKTLWDLSVIAYIINKEWFVIENISCPNILEDGRYELTTNKHEIVFVNDLFRNKIFHDYFIKMEKYK